MVIKNSNPHLGDALMCLGIVKEFVWAGVPNTNALFLHLPNVDTTPAEHITHWDVDLSNICYPTWDVFAGELNIEWDGKPANLIVTEAELAKHKLHDTGRRKVGVCYKSRDKHRSYPHGKDLVKRLKKHFDVYVFGLQQLPIRQLVSEISQLDLMISVDTGLAHIAGCFDIPLIIIEGPTDCQVLYSCYKNVSYVSTQKDRCNRKPCVDKPCKHINCMYLINPGEIVDVIQLEDIVSKASAIQLHQHEAMNQERIVVVRMKGIGDVLMTWFGLEVLRRDNPNAHITYVTSATCADLFYGQDDLVDKVFVSSWEYPPHGIPRLPADIRNVPADRLIELDNRIDFHDTIEKTLGNRALLHTSPRADNFAKLMDVNLGENIFHRMLNVPDTVAAWASKFIAEQAEHNKLICCQLDAQGLTRQWHIERWIQLSQLLVKSGYSVIWFSITPEHRFLKVDGVLNLACQTSLSQMIALMSKCEYAISTCSASIHLAHRLEKPVPIGIYGSTDYKLLAAYYDDLVPVTNYKMVCAPCTDWGHECLGQPGAPWCINQISPRTVLGEIDVQS